VSDDRRAAGRPSVPAAGGAGAPDDAVPPDAERRLVFSVPVHLRLTLGLHARGTGDPSWRFEAGARLWHTTRTPDGPATLLLEPATDGLVARAWGSGAGRAVSGAGALIGLDDDPSALVPRDPAVADAARRLRGLRIGRTGAVLEALVPAILEQKITGDEARRAWRALVRTYGEPAPGPGPTGLRLPPAVEVLAGLPYYAFHPLGVERRRAELIRAVAREASRLEALVEVATGPGADPGRAYAVLRSFGGIGPWTAAEVGIRAFGDADAVSVGDFHLPSLVTWTLAGEPHGTDERMLELLEPYRGQRGRVLRLLELGAGVAPRRGPRLAGRHIERL
jgi:3-methyladenine DNA glycosylase/8-oxoguanine DNA glycosylase